MRCARLPKLLAVAACLAAGPQVAFAQPLSYWLGATKLDGLRTMVECQNKVAGFLEGLMADRLDKKLAMSSALSAAERKVWEDDIKALRVVANEKTPYKAPDSSNPNHYLDGFTEKEFQAVHSMNTRFGQEVNLECEQRYGDISSRTGETTEGHARYLAGLRARFVEPVDVSTLPLEALPSPFPKPEVSAEEQLATLRAQSQAAQASSQAVMGNIAACTAGMTGLRWSIMADKMAAKLAASTSLSAAQRADFEADLRATRTAAEQNLPQPPAADAANPYRFMSWLTPEEQAEAGTQYGAQVATFMQTCMGN
jgi:hypothetical protein